MGLKIVMRLAAIAAVLVVAGGFGKATAQQPGMPGMMQESGGMPMGHDRMDHDGMMMGQGMMGRGMMMCRMGEHVEGRLAFLKTELKITDAQTPQWNAFADALRKNARSMTEHCAMMKEHGGSMMPASLPERLNMMERHMTTHLDSLRAMKAAVQPLYSALSDEQKKTADQIMKGHMGAM